MKEFSITESGLFSAGSYDEPSQTLTVTFRASGVTYDVGGVPKTEGDEFMSSEGKSKLWHGNGYKNRAVRK